MIDVFDFGRRTSTESDAFDYATELGLIPTLRTNCSNCSGLLYKDNSKQRHGVNSMLRCNRKHCRKRFSIFQNTIFENSKIKISKILEILYCNALKLTISETVSHTNASRQTIVDWNEKIRTKLCEKFNQIITERIGGIGFTVELDECHLYVNRRRIGRRMVGEHFWVVAGICRETRQVFFCITTTRSAVFLTNFVLCHVLPGTRIITDGWRGYNGLNSAGYIHNVINHSVRFVDLLDNTLHTNTIERLWRDLRENIPGGLASVNVEKHVKDYMLSRILDSLNSMRRFDVIIEVIKD